MTVSVPSMLQVGEQDGMVQVCATLLSMEDTQRNFTVNFATSDHTGILL